MSTLQEIRDHIQVCDGCEKQLAPLNIGDLVLEFNNLLYENQRAFYRAGREDEKKRQEPEASHA